MLRPITRRWGICFRSTQGYTVRTLTPKYTAASRTVSGSFSAENANPEAPVRGELVWGRCFELMSICKAFLLFRQKSRAGDTSDGKPVTKQEDATGNSRSGLISFSYPV